MKAAYILITVLTVLLFHDSNLKASPNSEYPIYYLNNNGYQPNDTTRDEYNYLLKVVDLSQCPGKALKVVSNSVSTYIIGPDHKVYFYDDIKRIYVDYGGYANEIALSPNGEVYYIGNDNTIYKRNEGNNGWFIHSTLKAKKIAFGGHSNDADDNDYIILACISIDGDILTWSSTELNWQGLDNQPSAATDIAVDDDGTIWYIDNAGIVWSYNTASDKFSKKNGTKAKKISIGDDGTVCVLSTINAIFGYDGSDWIRICAHAGSNITEVAISNQNMMYYILSDSTIWETNGAGNDLVSNRDVYQIFNLNSNLVMEDSSLASESQIYQNENTGLDKQLWRAKRINDSAFAFINVMSGKTISLATNTNTSGISLITKNEEANSSLYQQWVLKDTLDGSVTFRNNGSLLCPEVAAASMTPFAPIRQAPISNNNQIWYLKPYVVDRRPTAGYVEGGGNFVSGWAYDLDMPSESIYVYIYEGGILIDSIFADFFRKDVVTTLSITGGHGFFWQIPDHYFDGLPYTFTAKAADLIPGMPVKDLYASYTFQYQPCQLNTINVESTTIQINVGADGSLIKMDEHPTTGMKLFYKWNGNQWNQLGTAIMASSFSVDKNGRLWVVKNDNTLIRLQGCNWINIPGQSVKKVSCGSDGTVAVIGLDNHIYEYDSENSTWEKYARPGETEYTTYPIEISVDNAGQIWFIDSNNKIWYWNDILGDWTNLTAASGKKIRCGIDGSVFWTGINNFIYKWNSADSGFVINQTGSITKDFAVYDKNSIFKLDASSIHVPTCFTANTQETDAPYLSSNQSTICLTNGTTPGTTQLTASMQGGVWTSLNSAIVTVNPDNGLVTAKGTGTASISYKAGGCYTTAYYPITVVNNTLNTANTGNALDFNGTNNYVSLPAGFPITNELTYEAWIHVNKFNQGIMTIMNYDKWVEGYIHMQFLTNKLAFGIGGGVVCNGTYSFQPNTWYHIAVTYSVSAQITKMYVNGQLTDSFTNGTYRSVIPNLPVTIGAWNNTNITRPFDGKIDELRVWNKVLSANEIKSLMNKELSGNEPNLVSYYNFNKGLAGGNNAGLTTLSDKTGNGRNGQLNNFNLNSSTNSNWVSGAAFATSVNGNKLHFDGIDDYVSIPANTNIPVGNSAYTLEAMIKPTIHATNGIIGYGSWWTPGGVNALRLGTNNIIYNYWWDIDLAVTSPINLTDGNWHHIAATYDGTTRKIFVDGILAGSDQPTPHIVSYTSNLAIGRTFTNEYFNGSLDEVRIWKTARTQAQIQSSMSSELAQSDTTGLVAYYNFNQGEANLNNSQVTQLTDVSVNKQNTGLLNNFTLSGPASNWIDDISGTHTVSLTCADNFIQLNNATPGGSWSSSNPNVATVSKDGLVNAVSIGTAYVTYLFTNAGGCTKTVSSRIQVLEAPASVSFTATPSTVCEGTPVMFVAKNICSTNTNAIKFNGSGSGAIGPLLTNATDNITLELWAKWDGNGTGDQMLVYNGARYHSGFGILVSQSGNIMIPVSNKGSVTSNVYLKAGLWQHIAITRQGGTWSFFLNGIKYAPLTNAALAPEASTSNGYTPSASGPATYIGMNNYYDENFKGSLDEIKLWTVVRSNDQILADMSACSAPATSGLSNYFAFNDGAILTDAIGGKHLFDIEGNSSTGMADAGVTGTSFNWNFNDGYGGTVGVINHLYNTTGSKIPSLTVTTSGGCIVSTNTTVTVTTSSIAHIYQGGTDWSATPYPPVFSCCNNNYTLSCATPGGVWSSSNPNVATINSATGVITTNANGYTTFTYTVTGSACGSRSIEAEVRSYGTFNQLPTVETARIEQDISTMATVNIFPNPTKGKFTVRLGNGMEQASILVQNILGAIITSNKSSGRIREIDLTGYSKGTYLIKIIDSKGQVITRKLIVQ